MICVRLKLRAVNLYFGQVESSVTEVGLLIWLSLCWAREVQMGEITEKRSVEACFPILSNTPLNVHRALKPPTLGSRILMLAISVSNSQ